MTGLKNRNAYEEKLSSLQDNPKQLHGLRVVMIDINGLKGINDTYGHDKGDEAIKIVARCLTDAFGSKDFCARTGGDEFIAMSYSDTSEKTAELHRLIKIESYFVDYPLSISVGNVEYDPRKDNGIDMLLKRCDKLMYMRKKGKVAPCAQHLKYSEGFELNHVV